MRTMRLALVAAMVLALALAGGGATAAQDKEKDKVKADNKARIVGKWEVAKADKGTAPEDLVIEFTKDGKMTMAHDGKSDAGTYKLDGDKLTITRKDGDKEGKSRELTIKKLTDKQLLVEDEKGKTVEFRRPKK